MMRLRTVTYCIISPPAGWCWLSLADVPDVVAAGAAHPALPPAAEAPHQAVLLQAGVGGLQPPAGRHSEHRVIAIFRSGIH